jgi:hypothetical protein
VHLGKKRGDTPAKRKNEFDLRPRSAKGLFGEKNLQISDLVFLRSPQPKKKKKELLALFFQNLILCDVTMTHLGMST